MRKCQSCGFNNKDNMERCLKCDAILITTPSQTDNLPIQVRGPSISIVPIIRRSMRLFLQSVFTSPLPEDLPHRQPYLAALMSLIPGAGQLYNHRFKKACWVIFFWLIGLVVVLLTLKSSAGFSFGSPRRPHTFFFSNLIIMLFGTYVLWMMNDAFVDACRINGQQWTSRNSWALFFGEVCTIGILAIGSQLVGSPFVKFLSINQAGFEPTFSYRDRVIVETVSYMFRDPRRGEIVMYNPERFTIEQPGGAMGGTMWSINEQRSYERVIGLPGDVVERRDGFFYINGVPLPVGFEPLGNDYPKANFRIEADEDQYILLFTHVPIDRLVQARGNMMGDVGSAPRMDSGFIVQGWEKACIVPREDIQGRVFAIYHIPPHRRWLKTPADPIAAQ